MKRKTGILLIIIFTPLAIITAWHLHNTKPLPATESVLAAQQRAPVNYCASYQVKTVIVSIQQRHLWACDNNQTAYDSAVVTGYTGEASTLTPAGTYQIYAKATDRTLKGSDEKGSWNDYVNYWLPFLDNQYGTYGFHDATWRQDGDFGKIDPASTDASHGCVELPLAAAKWVYDWAPVGTSVVIED